MVHLAPTFSFEGGALKEAPKRWKKMMVYDVDDVAVDGPLDGVT